MDQLPSRLAEISPEREVVAVCKRGMRSFNVANWLRGQGRNAVSLQGGIDQWKALGLPLKKA
jgi:rhodanese-related sulfurtransferase